MKKFIGKFTALALSLVILFAACKKDETGGSGGGASSSKRLVRTEASATEYSTYEYNAEGLLEKVTDVESGGSTTLILTYGSDKKLVEALSLTGDRFRPVYAGNKFDTLKIYTAGSGGVYSGFFKYEYTSGKNTKRTLFSAVSGVYRELQRTTFAYSGAGDLTSQSSEFYDFASNRWKSSGRFEYTKFDDRNNPASLAGLVEAGQISGPLQTHNVLEEKEYDGGNILLATTESTISYDGDGYPAVITERRSPAGGAATVKITKYTYSN